MGNKPSEIGMVRARNTLFACLVTMFVSVFAAQDPAYADNSEFAYDLADAIIEVLEDTEWFQELSDSDTSNFRDHFAERFDTFREEFKESSANDDRSLLQRQLDSLAESAPDLHEVLDSSGYEKMEHLEKYRTLVPLLRENRWGMDDSSTLVNTLDRIEELLDSVSSTAVRGFLLRIVGQGADRLMYHYSSALNRVASHDARRERISVVADQLPIITGDYFSCSDKAHSSLNGCFAGSAQEYFENEIVLIVNVLENYEKDKNAIKEWRRRFSFDPYDEKLEKCTGTYSDEIVLCADAMGKAAEDTLTKVHQNTDD